MVYHHWHPLNNTKWHLAGSGCMWEWSLGHKLFGPWDRFLMNNNYSLLIEMV